MKHFNQHFTFIPKTLVIILSILFVPQTAWAADAYFQGSETCMNCHGMEYETWTNTKHHTSFRTAHKNPLAKEILAAVGGAKNMRRNETCQMCHFTPVQESPDTKARVRESISCEKCHGASSNWLDIHNNYGGEGITRDTESPEHKAERLKNAKAAGIRWPHHQLDLALNCMDCHGLAHDSLKGETIATMLEAGHPLVPEWEYVKYSQGSVRHRFYPPNVGENQEMTQAELSRALVVGAAAKLVSAKKALPKSDHPIYQTAQVKRVEQATAILSAVKSVPEVGALIASPTEENARKVEAAVADKDLSGEVGSLLPDKSTYK